MQVDDGPHPLILIQFCDELLDAGHLREADILIVDVPLPIEVVSHDVAAVVAEDDSVGVDHRDDLEDEVLAQELGLLGLASQKVHHSFADVGALGFAWVLPRQYHYNLPVVLFPVERLRYCQQLYGIVANRLPDNRPDHRYPFFWGVLDQDSEVVTKLGHRVGIAMRHMQRIVRQFAH